MPIKETPEEREVRKFFEHLGYTVTRVAEAEDAQTADYRVRVARERLLVEVKGRGPDVEFARQLDERSRAESEQPMARTNTISRQIREAADQLAATEPDDPLVCRLVAFVAAGDDPDLQVEQFQKTLYGIVDLVSQGGSGAIALPCFYFTFGDFFRFRHVDGAVVLSPRGARLCVNAFGQGIDRLRGSSLYERVAASEALTDPDVIEERGKAYLADTDIDRRDEAGVLA